MAPPPGARALLPLGSQVLATFWEKGLRLAAGTRRLRVRISSADRMCTLACSPVPEPQNEHTLFVTFGRTGAHAALYFDDDGSADAMYLFLPPSSAL